MEREFTVNQLIAELQAMANRGYGENEVQIMVYNGGDDAPANVYPVKPETEWSPVRLNYILAD